MAFPEIHRGDFVYRDTFFAEVGENKRHPRASIAEIKDKLLPKKGSIPPKDNVGHWYEAQLLHYGLPRTKEKNTAKTRLLQAMTQGLLVVPSHIVQMEAEMKKEYATAGRKAKAEAKKADQKLVDKQNVPNTKKRKQDGGELTGAKATSTKICVTVGDVTFNIDHQSGSTSQPSAKKQKKTAATDSTIKSIPELEIKAKNIPRERIKRPAAESHSKMLKVVGTAPGKKQTARKSTGSTMKSSKVSATPEKPAATAKSSVTSARPKQTARRTQPHPSTYLDEVEKTDAPPPYEAHEFATSYSHTTSSPNKSNAIQISGYYPIDCPDLDFDERHMTLRIDHHHDKLWGRFDIGYRTGVIMVNGIDSIVRGENTSFGWRSRNEENTALRFGKGCDGRIEFDGRGFMRGVFYGIMDGEDLEFEGEIEYDDAPEAAVIEQEWNEFPDIAYGGR